MPENQGDDGTPVRAKRGFAAMSAEKRLELQRKGGKAVPNEKRGFAQDRELAASAGRKGGAASWKNRR